MYDITVNRAIQLLMEIRDEGYGESKLTTHDGDVSDISIIAGEVVVETED